MTELESDLSEWSGWLCINNSPESKETELWSRTAKMRLNYTVFRKKTPTHILFHISMSDM